MARKSTSRGTALVSRATVVPEDNRAPVIKDFPDADGHPGNQINISVTATDPDGDTLTYSLINNPPSGATMTGNVVNWTPTWAQVGSHTLTVQVTDPGGLFDVASCTVFVINQPPELNDLADQDAHPGNLVTFTATANDPDGDALTFALVNTPPSGASITANGLFTWTPNWSQIGSHTITVRVTDPGGLADVKSCIITVGNQPPELNDLADQAAHPGRQLTFTATATDPDNDPRTFALVNNPPSGVSIGPTTGVVTWTPTWSQLGSHTITVRVIDPGGLADVKSCVVSVENEPPVLDALSDWEVPANALIEFTATASDPDGDPRTFSLINSPPSGASITANGDFSWTPSTSQVGSHVVTVRVLDPGGLSDTGSFVVTVLEPEFSRAAKSKKEAAAENGAAQAKRRGRNSRRR